MPALSDYTAGTITLTNNSTAFTGSGTGWQAADFREGDVIFQVAGQTQWTAVVQSISSNTAGTLVRPWGGATGTYAYRMRYMADGARVTAQARNLIELLGNGNLQAEASLTGAADTLSYFTGPAAKALTPLTPFARTLLDDADAAAARGTLVLGSTSTPTFASLLLAAASATRLTVERTGSAENSVIEVKTTAGSVFFGQGAAGKFAVKGATNLSVAPWLEVDATSLLVNGALAFHQMNILGTVSQSSGVPTGAIIESGSNANGEFTRFADGTQICRAVRTFPSVAINIASLGGFRSVSSSWTFPASFTAAPSIAAIPMFDHALSAVRTASSTTAVNLSFTSVTAQAAANLTADTVAVGRWF